MWLDVNMGGSDDVRQYETVNIAHASVDAFRGRALVLDGSATVGFGVDGKITRIEHGWSVRKCVVSVSLDRQQTALGFLSMDDHAIGVHASRTLLGETQYMHRVVRMPIAVPGLSVPFMEQLNVAQSHLPGLGSSRDVTLAIRW